MATKADIVLKVIDQATKKLKEIAAGVRSVAAEEKGVSTETAALRSQWANLVSSLREAGSSFQEIAQFTGLTREEFIALGYSVEELTALVEKQGVELLRTPGYIMGYRGRWLNLIATLGFGVSIFKTLHKVVERLLEPLTAADQRVKDFNENLKVFIPDVEEWARQARQAEKETFNWGEAARFTIRELLGLGEEMDLILDLFREHELVVKRVFGATQELTEIGLRAAAEAFRAERQQILETSGSTEEYIQRILELYNIVPEVYQEIDSLTRATFENAMAMEFAAEKAAKLRKAFERILGVVGLMADLQEEAGGYVRDLADTHDAFADRVGDALFRAEQAWESFQFRLGQASDAFNFRMGQMQARFEHQSASRTARAGASGAAAAARFQAAAAAAAARQALKLESIRQDHYDRLEDMARKHQEDLRRMLQRAPWYLQRTIRDYQKQKKELEERGDKEGLARLKKNFLERIRIIDPVFAEELGHLEELQQDERDVEEREFKQKLDRTKRQYAISRAQAEANAAASRAQAGANAAISLADAIFAYEQQKDAAEFAQQQRLDAMEFAYGQQKEASDRAYGEALEDYEDSLDDIARTFGEFMRDFQRDMYKEWFEAGYQATRGWYGGFGWPAPPRPEPSPPEPRWPRKQAGMPYVPTTMPVIVHAGEAILRKEEAAAWRGGEGGSDIYIQFYGPVYMRTHQEVRELATEISREMGRKVYVRRG